jgi:hypothetical protein
MHLQSENHLSRNSSWVTTLLGLSSLTVFAPSIMAQDVVMPPPPTLLLPAAVQDHLKDTSDQMQAFVPGQTASSTELEPTLFRLGPVLLRPHILYRFLYGNGLQSSPGNQHDSIIQVVSPGIALDLGANWNLDYTPTLTYYSSSQFRNTVDQSVNLGWGAAYHDDWVFTGSQSYASTSDPNVETAAQTDQQNYSTTFDANRTLNDQLSLDLGLTQNINVIGNSGGGTNFLQNLASSRSWSTMDWFNDQLRPRLSVGLGFGFGYNQQDGSPDSINQQYQGRVNWRATDKISFQLGGGLQDQEYLSGGASSLVTPIFSAGIQYQPFDHTQLSLNASRTVSASAFQNQVTEASSITVDLNQRLLGRLTLDLSGGYTASDYIATSSGLSTGRSDDTYNFSTRLSCPFLQRGTVSLIYEYSDNTSSQTGFAASSSAFGFTSNQVGFEIGWRY